jgi:heptosyltransferase III
MTFIKRVNKIRRNLLRAITQNIGSSDSLKINGEINKDEIKRVLICRPNHRLGNMLLITPLVQEVTETFPGCTIDLFVKGNAALLIFRNYDNIENIIRLPKEHFKHLFGYFKVWFSLRRQSYDLVINAAKNSSSGRLSTRLARSKFKLYGIDKEVLSQKYSDFNHLAKYPVYSFREDISKLGIDRFGKEIKPLNIKLNAEELASGKNILSQYAKKDAKTISIFTFATGAKCYSKEWWAEFHDMLKAKYGDLNLVEILPVENVSQIDFAEPSYYSKDVREICSVMANTDIFVGADSGMMHLASASSIPTLGLFSVTNVNSYDPYGNKSKGLNTNNLSKEDIIAEIDRVLFS